ncbi:SOS response-associated peptidase [Goodfellowiella coeruleoviolacea]|uniref:Abasic site processing protein n=1 Tax=Goodfellowiella coeruleoviolacea TaxID=334858 RepID=A0AAE3GIL2_9PSEU|nr:SOS response-associated peptidase [Goodfellowiella coeruleoviolacea]MCP2167979.1 putative SOS response-associated peptidase YedK [Goodfellowiella coeruleoviolacea]
MCGRFVSTRDPASLADEFLAVDATGNDAPRADYNVAPTKSVLAVVERHPRDEEGTVDTSTTERTVRVMRWGLVPHWAKDLSVGARMINARSESVLDKPAYRDSASKRRCLLPADGWYEWQPGEGRKQPFFITPSDGSTLAMAGIWSVWWDRDDEGGSRPVVTCAVLTTDAIGEMATIHHRMPLLLSRERWADWLDPDRTDPADLLAPPEDDLVAGLELRPVTTAVNSVKNNHPGLTEPVAISAAEMPAPTLFEVT